MSEIEELLNKEPLLSVIIPVYNVEDYLREALDSLRNQSYRNVEFIAINDGSTDTSGEILDEYAAKDDRFRVYHQENAGVSASRNRGLDDARGEIVYFFDSDDILVEGTFEKVIRRMVNTNSQLLPFSLDLIDKNGRILKRVKTKDPLHVKDPISGRELMSRNEFSRLFGGVVQMFFFQRSFLDMHDLKFDEKYIHEDESFIIEAIYLAERITTITDAMLQKRLHPNSIMGKEKSVKNVIGWSKAIERVLRFIHKHDVDPTSKETILNRLRQIAHTAIRTLNKLQEPKKPLNDYLPITAQKELGFMVRVHAKSPFLYRVLKFINRKLSS